MTKSSLRTYHLTLFLATLTFTLYEELHLRRWLFHHLGGRSVIAGSLPNFLAVLVISFAVLAVKLPTKPAETLRPIAAIVIGLALYEVVQIWMPHRTFDWNDLAATFVGGLAAWLLATLPRFRPTE